MAILASIAETPQSLSTLARDLELSPATAHAILTTLAESGWVQRAGSSRLFSLGPAFLSMARQALAPEDATARLLRDLASDLAMPVSLTSRFGDVLMVVDAAAPAGGTPPGVGQHTPYAVPFGTVFAAYDDDETRRAWLARNGELRPQVVDKLTAHLDSILEVGYSIERMGRSALRLVEAVQDVRTDATSDSLEPLTQALLSEIVETVLAPAADRGQVSTIAAAVLHGNGRPMQTLNAHPFRSMTAREAHRLADRLAAQARVLEGLTR